MYGIVNFTRVTNVFEGSVERWRAPADGRTLSQHLGGNDGVFAIDVNGRRRDGYYVPRAGDRVVYADFPAGAAAPVVTAIVVSVVIAAGSYLVNRLTMPQRSKDRNLDDFGPRNTFGGIQTISANGVPIPIVYGQVRLGGNIVDSFESEALDETVSNFDQLSDDLQEVFDLFSGLDLGRDAFTPRPNRLSRTMSTLNTRVVYAMGPVEELNSLEIDSRPINEYPGLITSVRLGRVQQASIPGFNRSVNTRLLADPVLQASPVTVTTLTEIDTAEVVLRFPNGVYKLKSDGFKYLHEVEITLEYRLQNATAWTEAFNGVVQEFATTALEYRMKLPELERNIYEIRVTRVTADETDPNRVDDFQLYFLNEIAYQQRNHPGIALAAFQQLPGDQVSPVNPANYTALVKGFNNIRMYSDPVTFTTGWTDNPAWCCAHFITEPVTGLGKFFTWDDVDIPSFIAWAAHCDGLVEDGKGHLEKRATFNRAFSQPTNAFDVLQSFAAGSGAMLIFKGAKFRAVIDEPRATRQVFNDGNVKVGSLGYAWFPKPELPTRIHGQFLNSENGYLLDSIMQEDQEAGPTAFQHEKRVQMLHITRPSQVSRELIRIVNTNKYVTRGVELRTGLQGVQLELGDVFGVSTKSIARGLGSGVIVHVALDERTLQLDDDITLDGVSTYQITVQHLTDGTIDTKTIVTSGPATTNIVQVADRLWSRAIQAGDKYSIGVADETVELFRVDELQMGDLGPGFEMRIRGGVFDERVYDLTPPSNPEIVVGDSPDSRDRVPPRLDNDKFNLSYRHVPTARRHARQQRRAIDIDWEPPLSFAIDHYEVWWRQQGGTWIRGGETKGRRFELEVGIDADTTYEVAARAVSPNGLTLPIDLSTSALVTTSPDAIPGPTVDLADYSEAFKCNELAAATGLQGVYGETIPNAGASNVGVGTDGHVEDPAGIFGNREYLAPIGDAGTRYFSKAFVASSVWDIRGAVSCTMAYWFKLRSTTNGGPFGFSIHNPSNANGQALWLLSRHMTFGANPAPIMFMLDGLSAFNFKTAQASAAVSPPLNTWQFNAGGYDAARNKVFHFWGRAAGEYYYTEADGFAAGFGFTGAAGCTVGFGQFNDGNGSIREQKLDHAIWWKGRALTESDLVFLWNDHVGRALDNLTD